MNYPFKNRSVFGRIVAILFLFALCATWSPVVRAQTIDTNHPPTPGDVLTNVPKGISAVVDFGLNLLPYWDKGATNAFGDSELEIYTGPTWKAATAGGATPFVDLGADYYFVRNFGLGADAVTFGNGQGSSVIDSAHLDLLGRKDIGNVAGFLLLGAGRDFTLNRYCVEFGSGIEFRYTTGVGMLVQTKYCKLFDKVSSFTSSTDHVWLTTVALSIHF